MASLRSLRARATSGLFAVALTLALVSAVSIAALTGVGGAIATILRENYRSVLAAEDMMEALERQDSAALFAAAGRGDLAGPQLAAGRAAFARAYTVEAHNITEPGEGELVREVDREYRAYVDAVDHALAAPHGAGRAAAYFAELLPRVTALRQRVQHVSRVNHAAMEAADRAATAAARRSVAVVLAVSAAAIVFALWFAWQLPRTIVRPVRRLADAAGAIGAGDLDVSVADPDVTELAPLAAAFRKMLAQLRAYRASSLGELLAARDLANATVECLLDPVVVLGPRDGEVLLTNAAATQAFGLRAGSPEELRAEGVALPAAFVRARDEVIARGAPAGSRNLREAMRWRGERADGGAERYFLVRAAPLAPDATTSGAASHPRRVIVVAQDVTRLRRIDDLKSDMVATVSHEFKTPLTSLRMATHLMLEPTTGPLTDAQREVVTTARDDTERLHTLVDELLDLVRIETEAGALHRVPVDLRRLLRDVADAHRAIARDKGVALEVREGAPLAPAAVDPERTSIAVANLVSNAIRHTPAEGRVVLDAEEVGGAVRLTVQDTGEGIPADAVGRLLDREAARRASAGGGRHGLGLMIAQEIVMQHGGEIRVQSAPGEGSVFTVVLPRADDASGRR